MTLSEFTKGLDTLTCCGGNCPFSSWCEPQGYQLGFGQGFGSGGTVTNQLSAGDFARALLATNQTQWVPRCMSSYTMAHDAPPPGGGARALDTSIGRLYSDGGELVVTLRGGFPPAAPPPPSALPPSANVSLAPSPGGKLGGLRLLESDAHRLAETYGKEYADRGATKQVFLAIDVEGTTGVPPSRWFFVTREAYLILVIRAS